MEVATLIAAIVAAAIALYDQLEKRRYVDFLRRVHIEAVERLREEQGVITMSAPVRVDREDQDLAFKALAEGIISVRSDGVWEARGVRLRGAG